ncbi:MazG nucleotide pyrophosphohydrolase domain-containing protein [Rhizobium sp. OAE497]|uniref:MazG nucleotide pyrophosphohydrolase domain-containing protein n=1 Tax=Rhizobium sp. OAE497 TaxID=2663796 RepID=UPI0018F4BC25
MEMTVSSLQEFQRVFDDAHVGRIPFLDDKSGDKMQSLEHLVVCLVGELGEFANLVKKVRRGDFEYDQASGELTAELADIFAYTLKTANLMRIDLTSAYLDKMKENEERFKKYEP